MKTMESVENSMNTLSRQVNTMEKPTKTTPATQNQFRHFCKHVRMSGNDTPATENVMTTCFEKERSCSFPHRHGGGRTKPEHQDETFGSFKTGIFPETKNLLLHAASKSMFRARLPSILITCPRMPRLPQNSRLDTISRSPDNGISHKHATQHL